VNRQHGPRERKRQGKDRVLELDHFERSAELGDEAPGGRCSTCGVRRHGFILKGFAHLEALIIVPQGYLLECGSLLPLCLSAS
jgi:hypothetical protein